VGVKIDGLYSEKYILKSFQKSIFGKLIIRVFLYFCICDGWESKLMGAGLVTYCLNKIRTLKCGKVSILNGKFVWRAKEYER